MKELINEYFSILLEVIMVSIYIGIFTTITNMFLAI